MKVEGQPVLEQPMVGQANPTEQPPQKTPPHATQSSEGQSNGGSFKFKDRELSSPEDVQKILDYAAEQEKRLGKYIGEVGFLREKMARLEGLTEGALNNRKATEVEETDWEKEFFENPKEALKKLQVTTLEQAKKLISDKELEYQQREARTKTVESMWNGFYEKHAHLAPYRADLVPAIREKIAARINHLPPEEALEILAEETNKRLLEITRASASGNNGAPKGYSEPATKSVGAPAKGLPKDPQTMHDLHKSEIDAINSLRSRISPSYATLTKE